MCGFISLSKYLANKYSAEPIMDITGRNGKPSLWTLHMPYNFPGRLPLGTRLLYTSDAMKGSKYVDYDPCSLVEIANFYIFVPGKQR